MKRSNRSLVLGVFFLAAAALLVLPGRLTLQENDLFRTILGGPDQVVKQGNPKVDNGLRDLREIYLTQGLEKARVYAERREADLVGASVRIVAESVTTDHAAAFFPAAQAVMRTVEALGGKVETSYRHQVQSLLPLESVEVLAADPLVAYVRLPHKPVVLETTSEGVAKTGADRWHGLAAYRAGGKGVKIAILDAGFKGYLSLLGTELPSTVTTRSFRADGSIEANQVHGAACAEIVHDMAPEAELYLLNFSTDVEHHNAANYIIEQNIDVVSYSMGWFNISDGKGTGPITEDVKKCANAGILWAGSAGNAAEDHWEGTYSDTNSNGSHNFTAGDEILNWWVPANTSTSARLNWDDWGTWSGTSYPGPTQDYDMTFWYWNGVSWKEVYRSENWQTGVAGQSPTEYTGGWAASISTWFGVTIRKYNATRNCKLELFTSGNSAAIEYNVPEGSLLVPADSPDAITLGASDWSTDAYHSYSSRGPTHDGRVKPDFAAPSGVSTVTYGVKNFFGTSASAPHMAGALGLMLGKVPYSPSQVRKVLEGRAVELGAAGKDNQFGVGRVSLVK